MLMLTSTLSGCASSDEQDSLSGADLSDADLSDAYLYGADLSNVDLTGVYWYGTTCPDGTNSDDNGNTCENNL